MKKLFAFLLVLIIATVACSSKPPSVRVVNQRSTKANVQVKLENSNTININDVAGGATSSYQEISEGSVLVNAVIQNENVSPTISFTAGKDKNHSIVILNSTPPSLRIDTDDK
ncbi:hypothetical protein C0389_09215 [bacterium]|nr:hypothetical protein [bacterium]